MALQSVVASFLAKSLPAGAITSANPGMAIRYIVADEKLSDGLDVQISVLNAPVEILTEYLGLLQTKFNAELRVLQDRPALWRGMAIFHDYQLIQNHPAFGALLRVRKVADSASIVFEEGMCIQRVDVDESHADEVSMTLRESMRAANLTGTVRIMRPDRMVEDWEPLQ